MRRQKGGAGLLAQGPNLGPHGDAGFSEWQDFLGFPTSLLKATLPQDPEGSWLPLTSPNPRFSH